MTAYNKPIRTPYSSNQVYQRKEVRYEGNYYYWNHFQRFLNVYLYLLFTLQLRI